MYNGIRSISIIGYGYVGGALGHLCEKNKIPYNVCDVSNKTGPFNFFKTIDLLVHFSEFENDINAYFIAVPTPSLENGECNTTIVEEVLTKLNEYIKNTNSFIFIKSTLVPGTCRRLKSIFPKLNIILCPEFLREATFKEDMYNAKFTLFGMDKIEDSSVEFSKLLFKRLYSHNSDMEFIFKTYEECELFKYTLNVYLATKIIYFNEIYEVCEKMNVDYQELKTLFRLDPRIGEYGTAVPGDDNCFGFAKPCLPKESRGMYKLRERLGLSTDFIYNVIKRNLYFRNK